VGWGIVLIAALVDMGSWRGGHRSYSRRRLAD
jgi:hypothetical protein